MAQLEWYETNLIELDGTVLFSEFYDTWGLHRCRMEAEGPNGNYLTWPSGEQWSLYRDSDGALVFEGYESIEDAMAAAESWCAEVVS